MAGSATLDPDVLVDSLVVDVVDELRGDLHVAFGVRPYRVYTVKRTWSGEVPGDGTPVDVETEITPRPKVNLLDGVATSQEPTGVVEAGEVKLTEVSLSYTQAELDGGGSLTPDEEWTEDRQSLDDATEWFIKITEAESRSRLFRVSRPPFKDLDDLGWVVYLHAVSEAR